LTLKPQYPQHRVIIIYPAEHMNLRAQNAFLKCLEEPAERSVILLLSERPAKLPATIASRCQQFALTTPDSTCGLAWLATQTAQQDLALPYRLAQGAPLAALAYCSGLTLALRQDCFKAWLEVANRQKSPVQIAEHWQKLPETQLLAWLISWMSDLIKCCFLSDADQLHNPDLQQPLQVLAQRLELSYLFKFYDVLINRYTLLDTTINKQLLLEELLIHWQTLNPTNNHVRPHS
jgi:DNA polymerase-3 subunit delta'